MEAACGTRIDPEKFFCSKQFLPKLTSPYPCCFCYVSASNPAPEQPLNSSQKQPPNSPLLCRNLLTVFTVRELLFCRFLAAVSAQNYHSKAAQNQSQISPLCYPKIWTRLDSKTPKTVRLRKVEDEILIRQSIDLPCYISSPTKCSVGYTHKDNLKTILIFQSHLSSFSLFVL